MNAEKRKPGAPPKDDDEKKTMGKPIYLRFSKKENALLKQGMEDLKYSNKSDFCREMINRGIRATKETPVLQEQIEKLKEELQRLKSLNPCEDNRDIITDIIEYLMEEPSGYSLLEIHPPSKHLPIWKTEDFKEVFPRLSKKRIREILSSNDHIFEYIQGEGWRLRDILQD
jgi:hypothetical protein